MAEKILVVNASRQEGSAAVDAFAFMKEKIEEKDMIVDICALGKEDIAGCIGCGKCIRRRVCIIPDAVNQCNACMWDGLLVLFDVLYDQPDEQAVRFSKRLFYSHSESWHYVPAACIGNARFGQVKDACRQIEDLFALTDMTLIARPYGTSMQNKDDMLILLDHFLQSVSCMHDKKPGVEIPHLDGFVR
ncbi:MAG: hypothetical protein SOI44_05450 [Lactimicrobium sp.]|jgi:multimeric flavodoxin WrbA|uniref:hypothetical protein n=1 Tax=Lactimicrobium sp. TaxID=2563780 RepID=UPI002F35995B